MKLLVTVPAGVPPHRLDPAKPELHTIVSDAWNFYRSRKGSR